MRHGVYRNHDAAQGRGAHHGDRTKHGGLLEGSGQGAKHDAVSAGRQCDGRHNDDQGHGIGAEGENRGPEQWQTHFSHQNDKQKLTPANRDIGHQLSQENRQIGNRQRSESDKGSGLPFPDDHAPQGKYDEKHAEHGPGRHVMLDRCRQLL